MLKVNNIDVILSFWFVILIQYVVNTSAFTPYLRENDTRPLCSCGTDRHLSTRVVGGHDAARGQFPYATALIHNAPSYRASGNAQPITPYCGGTLISDRHILTAAHCLKDRNPDDIQVDISEYNIKNEKKSHIRPAVRLILHPGYVPPSFNNDIGIIEFGNPIEFQNGTKASWLIYPETSIATGTLVTVYGWGRLEFRGGNPDILQTLDLPVVDRNHCQNYFQSTITKNMICAGGKEHEDACIGDSGSGLALRSDDDYILVGIVSFGKKCAMKDVPGIYTKLGNYANWVYNKTMNASCQPCTVSSDEMQETSDKQLKEPSKKLSNNEPY